MAWGSHREKKMTIGKVIFEISRKNDVHNNYETDNSPPYSFLVFERFPLVQDNRMVLNVKTLAHLH